MEPRSLGRDIAALIAVAAVAGFTYNALSKSGLPLIRVAPLKTAVSDSAIFGGAAPPASPGPAGASETASDSASALRIVSLSQMQRAFEEKRGLLYDARTPEEFAAGHIPGAVNLYAMAPETWVERIAEVPRDTLILIYCGNPHCPFGRSLAEFLGQFGFSNLVLFDEGWDAWEAAGLPAAEGGE